MATKKISDLQLRSNFDATCALPVDDASQTWRVTGAQMKTYLESNLSISRSNLAAGAIAQAAVQSKTATFTAATTDDIYLCDATSGAITANLPAAAGCSGKVFRIKKVDSSTNAITLDGNASETIDGALTKTLTTQYESLTVVSNGTNWSIV